MTFPKTAKETGRRNETNYTNEFEEGKLTPQFANGRRTSDCKERQTRGHILTCFSSGHCMMHRSVFISVPNAQETTYYITVFQGYYLIKTRCQLVMNRLRNCTETINKKMNSSDLFPEETLGQANYRIRV